MGYVQAYWQLGSTNDERLNMMCASFNVKPIFSVYGEDAHIKGPKQVLGKTVDTFDDVLDMLAKHPQTARYISTKLWEYLVTRIQSVKWWIALLRSSLIQTAR
ncbi:MAG: DUF1800 family protein [Fimbriimonadaceae bacterium]